MKKKTLHMTCGVILKWFQAIELFRQVWEQMKVQGGLDPGYIAGYGRRLTPSTTREYEI